MYKTETILSKCQRADGAVSPRQYETIVTLNWHYSIIERRVRQFVEFECRNLNKLIH